MSLVSFKYDKFQVSSMRKLAILLAVLLIMPVFAGSYVFNDTNGFVDDTYVVYLHNTTNYGTYNVVDVYSDTVSSNYMRTYLKINLSSIPDSDTVTSALLYLRAIQGQDNFNVTVNGMSYDNWNQTTVTWTNQPCGTVLNNLSANCSNSFSDSKLYYNAQAPYFMVWNVTGLVQSNLVDNLMSIIVKGNNETLSGYYSYFNSLETASSVNRPYLLVNTTNGTGVNYTSINFTNPQNITMNRNYVYYNFTPVNANKSSIPCYIEETKVGSSEVETSVGSVSNNTLSSTLKTGYTYGQYFAYIKCQNSDSSFINSSVVWFRVNSQPIVTINGIQTVISGLATVSVNYTPVDYDSVGSIGCVLTVDNSSYPSVNATLGIDNVQTVSGIDLGIHNLTVTCTDGSGYSGLDSRSFIVSISDFKVCFYTYDDYRDWISNSSISISNKPNAVRKTVLFNDSLGKVWLSHNVGLHDYYYCANLVNGCADFNISVTSVYDAYLADNTNFDNNCYPYTINPRYDEYVGRFYLVSNITTVENRFVSFEDSATNSQAQDTSLLQTVRQQIFFLLFIVVVVAGAYLGMISGGSGVAVLTFVGIGVAILLYFKDYILFGGLI